MIVEKIERSLSLLFLMLLIITQAMVFVATKAASDIDYNLQAVYIEPAEIDNIIKGQEPHFRAHLSADGLDSFSSVFFTLTKAGTEEEINFEAAAQADGSYISTASWNTNNFSEGQYYLSANAQVFDDDEGLIGSYASIPMNIILAQGIVQFQVDIDDWPNVLPLEFQFPRANDIVTNANINENGQLPIYAEWQTGNLEYYRNDFDLDDAVFRLYDNDNNNLISEVTAISTGSGYSCKMDFIDIPHNNYRLGLYPMNLYSGQYSSGATIMFDYIPNASIVTDASDFEIIYPTEDLAVRNNLELLVNYSGSSSMIYYLTALIYDDEGELKGRAFLENATNDLTQYSRIVDVSSYAGGNYSVVFYASEDSNDLENGVQIGSVNFGVSRQTAELSGIDLISPSPNSIIYSRNFDLNLYTDFSSPQLAVTFVNSDDPAISTQIIIPATDSHHWNASLDLDESFIDGDYTLIARGQSEVIGPDTVLTMLAEESFTVSLQTEESEEEQVPEEIIIRLLNAETNMTGNVMLLASSNFSAHGTGSENRINWVFEPTGEGASFGTSVNDATNWNAMADYSINQADNLDTLYPYMVSYDTTQLPNGNYYLYVWTGADQIASDRLLVTVFNEENVDDLFTDGSAEMLLFNNDDIISNGSSFLAMSNVRATAGGAYFVLQNKDTGVDYKYNAYIVELSDLPNLDLTDIDIDQMLSTVYFLGDVKVLGAVANFDVPEGEYKLFFQLGATISNKLDVRVVYENQNLESPILRAYEAKSVNSSGGLRVAVPFVSNFLLGTIDTHLISRTNQREFQTTLLTRSSWEILESYGVSQTEDVHRPYIFYVDLSREGHQSVPDGDYYVFVEAFDSQGDKIVESNDIYFSVVDGKLDGSNVDNVYMGVDEEEPDEEEPTEPDQTTAAQSSGASVAIRLNADCVDAGISDQDVCSRFMAMISLLDSQCIEQQIYDTTACEDYLNRTQVDFECQEQGIVDKEQCKDYLLEKYGGNVQCELEDKDLCVELLRNQYLNRLVVGQKKQDSIEGATDSLIGKSVTVGEIDQNLLSQGVSEETIPLQAGDTRVFLAKAQREAVLEDKDSLTIIGQAVMVIDTDGDELSDDLEEYYGTDIDNPDTDGDGYPDGTEIANGYNPLGEGKLEKERTFMDEIILSKVTIEQPKAKSKKISKDFEVEDVSTLEDGKVKLTGKAEANSWVALYLYSDLPLVMTTKTDASGNWSYDIKHSLADGHHRVYVTVNDSTGKIVKQSSPVSFLVKSAQAVTANDYFDDTAGQDNVNSFLIYYILGAAFLVVLALGVIIFLHKGKRQEVEL